MKTFLSLLIAGILVSSASAQSFTVSGGGTITLGQSANIVASPSTGVATAYNLIENGIVVQTVGTFGIGGSGTNVGRPHTFTVTPTAPGTYIYSAQVALNLSRAHIDYLPSNNSVALTVVAPNQAPTIVWTSIPGTVESDQGYTISAHGHDDDGNLTQVNIWKNGQPFAFAGGGDGTDGDSSNPSTDTGPQNITFTAQAVDAMGATSALITQTVAVAAPPPVQYSLLTAAGVGGTVSPGGTYNAGTVVIVTATPDGTHDFAGWSGDASGVGYPVSIVLDRSKAVQANFSLKVFALTTSATTGGGVTPGGSYPYGTSLIVSATPDGTHRFIGWAGGASGSNPSVLLTLTSPLNVQAVFTNKTAQTVTFPPPGNQPVGTPAFALSASASSGLPVTYMVLSGPATLSGNQLTIAGPGSVTVQASQPGDATYLPAPSVSHSFNAVAAALLKYRPAGRTLFQASAATGAAPFVLEKP